MSQPDTNPDAVKVLSDDEVQHAWANNKIGELVISPEIDALRRSIDLAKTNAPHTEETGEVCTDDCEGCLNPVAAIIHDRNAARGLAYQRGLEIDRAQSQIESAISLNTALREQLAQITKHRDDLLQEMSGLTSTRNEYGDRRR